MIWSDATIHPGHGLWMANGSWTLPTPVISFFVYIMLLLYELIDVHRLFELYLLGSQGCRSSQWRAEERD